jgi:hypothetical protein
MQAAKNVGALAILPVHPLPRSHHPHAAPWGRNRRQVTHFTFFVLPALRRFE